MIKLFNKKWRQVQTAALRRERPVSNCTELTIEQQHDWVNYVPIEPKVRLWLRIAPKLDKLFWNSLLWVVVIAICYAGFRALDYRAIEDGCLRYELNPNAVSQQWEKICSE